MIGILCLFVVLCSFGMAVILDIPDKEQPERAAAFAEQPVHGNDTDTPFSARPLYIAAAYGEENIAIFSTSDGKIIRLLDVLVRSLPGTDIKLLTSGIPLFSDDELCLLIADYTG